MSEIVCQMAISIFVIKLFYVYMCVCRSFALVKDYCVTNCKALIPSHEHDVDKIKEMFFLYYVIIHIYYICISIKNQMILIKNLG